MNDALQRMAAGGEPEWEPLCRLLDSVRARCPDLWQQVQTQPGFPSSFNELCGQGGQGGGRVEGSIVVDACRNNAPYDCSESTAVVTEVCAQGIPEGKQAAEVQLYTKFADDPRPWDQARVIVGQGLEWCRFLDIYQGAAGMVCAHFAHWSSHKKRVARIVVVFK